MLQAKTFFASLAALLASAAVSTVPAYADIATGFEPPAYTTGPLSGQNGWQVFGPGVVTVENGLVFAGTQAVFVDGGSSATGQSGPFFQTTAGPLVDFSAEVYLASSSVETGWQFAAVGTGLVGFAAGINIDPASNSIHAITGTFPIIGTFARNQWNLVDIDLNYTTQTYGIVLNGTTIASGLSFCGNNSGPCNGASVSNVNADYFFDTFGSSALSGSNDSGFIDNFSVTTTPEPSFYAVLACGLAGVVIGRRRSFRQAK